MIRTSHVALGDPGGPAHEGHEFDCGVCRAVLLEAFRAPAAPDRPAALTRPPGWALPDHPLTHNPAFGASGGVWRAVCSCGWRKEGPYRGSDKTGEDLAMLWAQRHQIHPLEGTEDL